MIPQPSTPEAENAETRQQAGRWRSLFAFAFATVVDGSEGNLTNGLFPTIRDAMGLSLVNLSVLTNINRVISAVLGPAWAVAADRFNRKRILVLVTGLWGMWTVATGLAGTFPQLLALYAIASLGSVASAPIIMSIISDMFTDNERGKAMGAFGAMAVILAAIVTPLVSEFAEADMWRYGYSVVGGLSVLSGVLIWRWFHDPGRGASDKTSDGAAYALQDIRWRDFAKLFQIPTLVLLFLQKLLNAGLLVTSFGTVYMVDVFGYTNTRAMITVFVPLLLGNIIGNVLGGVLGDRYNRAYPRRGRIALVQVGFACSAVMSYLCTQVAWSDSRVFYLVYFVWGIFLSFATGLDRPMVAAITPPELRSTAFALWMSMGDALANLLWVSLAGWLGDRYGLQPVFLWLLTGVMSVRALVWFAFYRPYPRDLERMTGLLERSRDNSRA